MYLTSPSPKDELEDYSLKYQYKNPTLVPLYHGIYWEVGGWPSYWKAFLLYSRCVKLKPIQYFVSDGGGETRKWPQTKFLKQRHRLKVEMDKVASWKTKKRKIKDGFCYKFIRNLVFGLVSTFKVEVCFVYLFFSAWWSSESPLSATPADLLTSSMAAEPPTHILLK